jgi:hypothetical protein
MEMVKLRVFNFKLGYVSYQDLEDHLKSLKVFVTKGEFNHLITLFDKEKKGFLDFKRFSTSITPKMSQNLVEDDQEDENYMFKKDRNFLIPSKDKVQDNLRFAKTFTEKMNAIKNTLLPDKDMILSIFLCEINISRLKTCNQIWKYSSS